MNLGLRFTAACGFAALLAAAAPAAASTFSYDLTGDTSTEYTIPGGPPNFSFIDLTDTSSGSSTLPGYTLSVGDTIDVTLTLNHPVTFTGFDVFLQDSPGSSWIYQNPTFSYSLAGVTVPEPSSNWGYVSGSGGVVDVGETYAFWGTNTFSFDKVIVSTMITGLTDASNQPVSSLDLTEGWASMTLFNANVAVATTPLPGSLLLMLTSLGGLAVAARRQRALTRDTNVV